MVAAALVGMGLMQFIVSCTLSMLLRHVKRYAVLGKWKIYFKVREIPLAHDESTMGADISNRFSF